MAYQTPTALKARFEGGDIPTEQDFIDLFDSTHQEIITVTSFGAKGDGVTDDTTAIQNAINQVNKRIVVFPQTQSEYLISDKITIPADASFFEIVGRGLPTIKQSTDNKEIFYFSEEISEHWSIKNFRFEWSNDQTLASHPNSIGIAFDTPGNVTTGYYDFTIDRIFCENGTRCISVHPDAETGGFTLPTWGFTISNVWGFKDMGGAIVDLGSPGTAGSPRGTFLNLYHQRTSAAEESIRLQKMVEPLLMNVEFNLGSGRQMLLNSCDTGRVINYKTESASTTTDFQELVSVTGSASRWSFEGFSIDKHTVNVSNEMFGIRANNGARVRLEDAYVTEVTHTSGDLAIIGVDTNSSVATFRGQAYIDSATSTFPYTENDAGEVRCENVETLAFYLDNVPGTATTQLLRHGGQEQPVVMHRPGSIVGLAGRLSEAVTAGSVNLTPRINGTQVSSGGYQVTITSGQDLIISKPPHVAKGLSPLNAHEFSAGDRLDMVVVTTGFTPTTADLTASLIVAYHD